MSFAGGGLAGGAVASKCDTVSYVAPFEQNSVYR
jgi:hypothetical protein